MKIICVDNFDRVHKSDELIANNVNEKIGKIIVSSLNAICRFSGSEIYKLVKDDYSLYEYNQEIGR